MKFDASIDAATCDAIREIVEAPGFPHRFGIIEAACPAEHEGRRGWLLWDYIYFSEHWFLPEDGSAPISLGQTVTDEIAAEEFEELRRTLGRPAERT